MGNILLDKEAADFALDYARFKNDNSESISLAALIGNDAKIPLEEKAALSKARKLSAAVEPSSKDFRNTVIKAYHTMNGQLPVMEQMMQAQSLSSDGATASANNSNFSFSPHLKDPIGGIFGGGIVKNAKL